MCLSGFHNCLSTPTYQQDNCESSNMEEIDNDLEIDGEVSEIIGFGLEVGNDVKKVYCSPYSSSISLVTLIYLS